MGDYHYDGCSFDEDVLLTGPDFDSVALDDNNIKAHQSKCTICHFDFSSTSTTAQDHIAHFQECWKDFQNGLQRKERMKRDRVAIKKPVSMAKQTSLYPLSAEIDSKADLGPNLSASGIPLTSCILCTRDLSNRRDEIDALNHRMSCMDKFRPTHCPICSERFYDDEGRWWARQDIIWHLHNCHHGGSLGVIAQDDFETSLAAWRARSEIAERTLVKHFGAKKNWGRQQHRAHYMEKMLSGKEKEGNKYSAGNSPLRKVIRVEEGGREVTIWRKTAVPAWIDLERFRRSSFSVLEIPEEEKLSKGFCVERVFKKSIPRPHPPPLPAPKVRETTSSVTNPERRDSAHRSLLLPIQLFKTNSIIELGQTLTSQVSPEVCPALSISEDEESTKPHDIILRSKIVELDESHVVNGFQAVSKSDKPQIPNRSQNPTSNGLQYMKAFAVSVAMPCTAEFFGIQLHRPRKSVERPLQLHGSLGSSVYSPGDVRTRVAIPDAVHLFTKRQPTKFNPTPIVYAHTRFLQNDSFIVFGEGVVPPRPGLL